MQPIYKIAISGATGQTGQQIVNEVLHRGHQAHCLVRKHLDQPKHLHHTNEVVSTHDPHSIDKALTGCDTLIIAMGARPSFNLLAPRHVDYLGTVAQIKSCSRIGIKRVILVTSLCTGKWIHFLNVFGLVLIQKRKSERVLEASNLNWTIIRPGQLINQQSDLEQHGIYYSGPNTQTWGSIPRKILARICVDAAETPCSHGKIIEVTSSVSQSIIGFKEAVRQLPT
ncbi:MAG: SDR family oxidoreductase [Pseudomonadota bacterium]|nr:SDR family oxidoreductase [Pseudomonadota bacterium]